MENEDNQEYIEENEEEVLDDDYLINLHRQLQEMKKQRKQAEQEAALLDNHVKCLKGEDQKYAKRIEVTRRETQKKQDSIKELEEKRRQKEDFRRMKELELERKRVQTKMQKDNNRLAIMMKQEERRKKIEDDVKNLRDIKKANDELRKYIEIDDISNKKTQADYIKSQHVIAEEKRRALELEKKSKIRKELEEKIQEEQERIQRALERKDMLESEEEDIIKRIQTTTQMHNEMLDNLSKLSTSKKK